MNLETPAVLVPPRPNLGPEPLAGTIDLLTPVVIGLLAVLLIWIVARPVFRRVKARRAADKAMIKLLTLPDDDPKAPGVRLIAWSRIIRGVLARRFGPAWAAKTTEELAHDPALVETLGSERAARLIGFLRMTDQVKFADPSGPHLLESDDDFTWLSELARELLPEAGAGARSRIKGK